MRTLTVVSTQGRDFATNVDVYEKKGNGHGKGETKVIYTLHNCNRLYQEIEQWVLESGTTKNQLWQGEDGNKSSLHA